MKVCRINELNRNTCTNPTNCKWLACKLPLLVVSCACSTSPPGGKDFVLWTCAIMCGRDRTRIQGNQFRARQPGTLDGCVSLSVANASCMPVCHATTRARIPCPVQEQRCHRHNANNTSRAFLLSTNGFNRTFMELKCNNRLRRCRC